MADIPDFTMKPSFPIASVIDAAQRNAQLQLQAREYGQKQLLDGLQSIGQVGQSLYDTKQRVAQSLALGRQFDVPDDVAKTMTPEQLIHVGTIKKNNVDADFMRNLVINLIHPGAGGTAGTAASGKATSPNGAILASDQTATPMPASNGSADASGTIPPQATPSTGAASTGSMPLPVQAPPLRPKTINKATADMAFKMLSYRPESVYSYDNNGNLAPVGQVPKGSKIERDLNTSSLEAKSFIGNDPQGNPLFADKHGNITRGKVPVQPTVPPVTGGPVLPKNSTMPTAQARSTAEFAETLLPHIDSMRDLIQQADAKGLIGPGAGRVYGQFLAGKIGTTGDKDNDRILGKLRAIDSLMKTGAMKVHFGSRGGGQMYDHFSDMLNTGKQSSSVLNGALDGIQEFMEGYANAGKAGTKPSPRAASVLTPEEQKFITDYEAKNKVKT